MSKGRSVGGTLNSQ
uniref:Uncharacterized protein n=1 Tax=Anguilla anguilla TaxID=7936 RepID=A0A0E9UXG6_ANGAN